MKAIVTTILIGLVFVRGAAEAKVYPRGQGLPLPWPFPWAKECPVNWQGMAGRYSLSDSLQQEQLDLKITVATWAGFRLVHLSRIDRYGELIADGFSFVSLDQRMLRMKMVPRNKKVRPTWALIKLYYSDWSVGCFEDHLVPILTLEQGKSSTKKANYYRLVKVAPGDE